MSKTGYFVYFNGDKQKEYFEGKLDFKISVIPYEGDDGWIEPVTRKISECLNAELLPDAAENCAYCLYREAVSTALSCPIA